MVSAGKPFLELEQWLGALESKLLFSDLLIDGYVVRLTEPQAKAAFGASAATPAQPPRTSCPSASRAPRATSTSR